MCLWKVCWQTSHWLSLGIDQSWEEHPLQGQPRPSQSFRHAQNNKSRVNLETGGALLLDEVTHFAVLSSFTSLSTFLYLSGAIFFLVLVSVLKNISFVTCNIC